MKHKRLAEVYKFIAQYKSDNGGIAPTSREIMEGCGLKAHSAVYYYLATLRKQRLVEYRDFRSKDFRLPGEIYIPPPDPFSKEEG